AIPPSAFYSRCPEEGQKYVRFCFAKKDETLRNALDNILEVGE
ncbi:MAG: methionine aminotransferase, partial [Bdellovibrionota bacterium]|nr:methionine aminotransferase [Bdellovibrionota bacterium]